MARRFAVSTLGMPGAPVVKAVRLAAAHGCHGIELRTHPDEEVHIGLSAPRIARLRAQIADEGLEVACIAGYAKVCAPGPDQPVITELRALIELAHRFGAPAVRVFPGGDAESWNRISAVLDDLRGSSVRLLIETHDSHPTGKAALSLVEPFAAPELVAVLWDVLHPWRHGEEPALTRALLGDYLGYVQIKDVGGVRDLTPVLPGMGAVPLTLCGALLRSWDGWVSLEWEKAWYPQIGAVGEPLRALRPWLDMFVPPVRD